MTDAVHRIDDVLYFLGLALNSDDREYMRGRILLDDEGLHFVAGWKVEVPKNGPSLRDQLTGTPTVRARTLGDTRFNEVVDLPPADQVRRVRNSFSLRFVDRPKFRFIWFSPYLHVRLRTGADLQFLLPNDRAKATAKAWVKRHKKRR